MRVFIRVALWWVVVRWGGEAVLVYGQGSLFVGVWLFASTFLLRIILSSLSMNINVVSLLAYTFVWLALSRFVGIDGVHVWWKYMDVCCIFCGWLTGCLAVKVWRGIARRLMVRAL